MDKDTIERILRKSGLVKEADNSEENSQDNSFDLSFERPSKAEPRKSVDAKKVNKDNGKEKTPRERMHELVKPQVEIAKQVIQSVNDAFSNITTKKYNDMLVQLKNLEKQIRGACQQIISEVESIDFDTNDNMICSPKAYSVINEYDSRDRSVLELVSAIVVFSNSLTSKNK